MAHDTVFVRGIRLEASIGVLDWEHDKRQPIEVDVELEVDTSDLIRTGELAAGVDFTSIMQIVRDIALGEHVDLVEVLAHRVACALVSNTRVRSARVQVRKYGACASQANHVGVEVLRSR